MARENIYQSLEAYYEKVDKCPLNGRQFNFFELVYVISGTGNHTVNENKFPYFVGDLFLITPNDCHGFELESTSEFMVVRFGESYIREYQWKSIDHIECLLYYASHLSGSILVNNDDKQMVTLLMQNLRQATAQQTMYNEDLIIHLVNAIIVIAARNIAVIKPQNISPNADIRILQILDYIQEYIRRPELLKVAVIAEKFGLSPTYLGSYFRKQCNESIQEYISSNRIRLIEHRLRFSDKRIHEIADEFGFADESHINKFFKRHKELSLKAYRVGLSN
ncbi:AraC family transcriptional regulator [Flavobacterium sp. F-65]|uniref:AraC family transcriptional regulator n=1 Tax=Flavobacterium pisciphilum TaxID=2893755 RepID=A0ABS8MQK7_9FLAO|nr:AraC family transcriptional regulator [Flavobacterium sp. F-65]MCC9070230.1 AraC family transcriptional regulator [Flavobacterium sp. F-65]